ncbi:MAG: TetR/AcrR family transcriptional regulator [Oscillospiraceae bacterium]|nr:TetR/AcrR family transcriptional regulator [Candidatus Limimonas coprohippi]MCQ2488828.1 TetR/AcrR family transcriptional regulator [Clostridia bacterium]
MAAPRKENVKDIIMDATVELLENQALDDISLAKIATTAGISKGTLYYHYKTKEDILIDITNRFLDQQWDDFLIWVDNKEKDTSLHRLCKYVIERNVKYVGPRYHLLSAAFLGNEKIRMLFIDRYREFQQLISTKIAERTDGDYADYLAWTALLISDGLIIQKLLNNENLDVDEFIVRTDKLIEVLSTLNEQ